MSANSTLANRHLRRLSLIATLVIAVQHNLIQANETQPDTLSLKIGTKLTVSGVSSGGYMATQYQIAHADKVSGAGIIAAGPYYCAQGNLMTAMQACLADGTALAQKDLTAPISTNASATDLKGDRVWLLHGQLDTRVGATVTDALYQQYQHFIPTAQIQYVTDKPFNHSLPTEDFGVECQAHGSPFIANCEYDAAGNMLNWLYPEQHQNPQPRGDLYTLAQPQQVAQADTGLADNAYLYVPQQCQEDTACQLHISFHGCQQNQQSIGLDYIVNGGFNRWANKLDLVVLYPQVASGNAVNPLACWDWWGYTTAQYHTQAGPQIQAVHNIVTSLQTNQIAVTPVTLEQEQ